MNGNESRLSRVKVSDAGLPYLTGSDSLGEDFVMPNESQYRIVLITKTSVNSCKLLQTPEPIREYTAFGPWILARESESFGRVFAVSHVLIVCA